MRLSLLIFAVILLWGVWGFLSKLAVQRIGTQNGLWGGLSFLLVIIVYLFITHGFPIKHDTLGIFFSVLAGISISLGSVIFYILLRENPAGFLVAVTALYPIITIILSVIILRESLSFTKIGGLILALASLFLLSL